MPKTTVTLQAVDDALNTLEKAKAEGGEALVPHRERLARLIGTERPRIEDAVAPAKAPAIVRPRAEMLMADRIAMGLQNYQGPDKAAAFFGWANPDGTAKSGDFDLKLVTVDRLVKTFSPEALTAIYGTMRDRDPVLTLGPDYGDPCLNFRAMISAMNATQGRTPQRSDAHVDPIFDLAEPSALEGIRIAGYRPTLMIDGARNPQPYTHDDPRADWAARLAAQQAFLQGKPFKGTDRLDYADLMGLSLAGQAPIDSNAESPWTYTVFDADEALTSSQVPRGRFRDVVVRPRFNWFHPEFVDVFARFRSVLRGNVLR